MQQYINSLANQANGLPISGATVVVLQYPSLSSATIYSVNSTATAIVGNSVVTDSNGQYKFYAPDGHYSLRMSGIGIVPVSIDDILLEDDGANNYVTSATFSASSGSSLVGFQQARTGAVARTVQSKLREIYSVGDYDTFAHYVASAFNLYFYSDNGANIERITDRLFVGGAANNDGTTTQTVNDWLSTYQNSVSRPGGPAIHYATLSVLGNTNAQAINSFVAGGQTQYLSANQDGIAISGFGLNNNSTVVTGAFAAYLESYRAAGSLGGAYASEMDVANFASLVQNNPYLQNNTQTINLQLGAGAQLGSVGTYPITAAINIQNNTQTFDKGIIFGSAALTGDDGTTGTAIAIALAKGHQILWYGPTGVSTSSLYCVGTTAAGAINQIFQNNVLAWTSSGGQQGFAINIPAATVNHLAVYATVAATNSVSIYAFGADTNIDIQLMTQGTGVLSFGTYTAGVVAQAGYITVKDSGGAVRRLLVG